MTYNTTDLFSGVLIALLFCQNYNMLISLYPLMNTIHCYTVFIPGGFFQRENFPSISSCFLIKLLVNLWFFSFSAFSFCHIFDDWRCLNLNFKNNYLGWCYWLIFSWMRGHCFSYRSPHWCKKQNFSLSF